MPIRLLLFMSFSLVGAGQALARPDPTEFGQALAAVIWQGQPPDGAAQSLTEGIIAEYPLLDAAITRGEPDYMEETYSAALLARSATHPATRAAMYDVTRYILAHAVEDAATNPMLAIWQEADPFIALQQLGVGLAESDIAAAVALEGAGDPPPGDTRARVIAAWEENAASPPNRFILTRIDAWKAGTLVALPHLSDAQRVQATGITWREEVPDRATTGAVTGTGDFIGWFSGVTLQLTEAERNAHPELTAFLQSGAAAGPMLDLLRQMLQNPASIPTADYDSYMMMFRLNNYMIGGGSIDDWQAGGAMNGWAVP